MIIRIKNDQPGHWALYEEFEHRCVEFGHRSGWPLEAAMIPEMRIRFVNSPVTSGYFITDDTRAHLLSWVLTSYGKLGILIRQCEGPAGQIAPLMGEFFESLLPRWIDEIHEMTKGQHLVEFIEMHTDPERDEEWQRLIPLPLKTRARMTVMRFEPKPKTPAQIKAEDPLERVLRMQRN